MYVITSLQSGLFSAVITAFIIDTYKMLQQDTFNLSAQVLAWLSRLCQMVNRHNGNVIRSTTTFPLAPNDNRPSCTKIRNMLHLVEEEAECGFAELQSVALQFTLNNLRSNPELVPFFDSLPPLLKSASSAKALRLMANESDFIT